MPRPRFVAIGLTVAVGATLGAWWYKVSPRAQTGPSVRSEHWPELGLDPHEVVFENGFRIVLIEDHRVPRVAASLQYRFGALSERNGEHGSAHFLRAHSQLRGAATAEDVRRAAERYLVPWNRVIATTRRNPQPRAGGIPQARDRSLRAKSKVRDERDGSSPRFRVPISASVSRCVHHHRHTDRGSGMRSAVTLGIGGGVTRASAQRKLESLTAGWQAPATAADLAPADGIGTAPSDRFRTIDEPGYTTWIAVGHPMPGISPADEAAVAVMTEILNIRLNISIREIRGLAHAAQLQTPATIRHAGLLHVRSGARPESVAPIVYFSVQELARIREPGGAPDGDELEQVKGGLVLGKGQGSLDGARDASATYAIEAARFGSLDHLMRWPQAVRAVTAGNVGEAARTYVHPEMMGTVVIGQVDRVRQARHPRWPVALDDLMAAAKR
jgi:hypothetical protein